MQRLVRALEEGGLDLSASFCVQAVNSALPPPGRLPELDSRDQLGLLFGNTRRFWRHFERHLEGLGAQSERELGPDPLDSYIEELVYRSLERERRANPDFRFAVRFSHQTKPVAIPIQRIAQLAGLSTLGPAHLSVHATFGPWIALRAVVVTNLDVDRATFDHVGSEATPCQGCPAPCRAALANALLRRDIPLPQLTTKPPESLSLLQTRWLAIRDVCPLGKDYRYEERQILYHYDERRDLLRLNARSDVEAPSMPPTSS